MAKDIRPFRKVLLGKRVKGEGKKIKLSAGRDSLRSLGVNHLHPTFQKGKENGRGKALRNKKKEQCALTGGTKSCQVKQSQGDPYRGTHGAFCFR